MPRPAPNRPLNPRRIGVIMMHTFTQLVRMKVFYFLGVFALILLASNLFNIQGIDRPNLEGVEVLRSIRSWSLGTMTLFSVVLGIVATALLLPKDVEDRTLYTILAKPVPRLDYLVGKLGGVLLLIFVSLLVMDLLMTGVLAVRSHLVVEAQSASALKAGWPADQIAALKQETLKQGPTWDLQGAVLAVFLRAVVISSTALMLSIVSTSTLFTTITGFIVYFIGNFQADAREMYLEPEGVSMLERLTGLAVATIFPDFQLFNIVDKIIEGKVIQPGALANLCGVTLFYLVLHLFVSWLIFSKKEF
ncbi:ABC transporter permease [Luteolibacter arcticus]|uniref:ABC transporter permease n=1 Tax=Luteolibacter arcticus TaxID=1581411 RepID=A0ABT3GF78_9BACT|nr:ABC transporter permease [Luteolibacter arcticus]MCW1922252.1 ABC transporter permease [Luteolibacter arcticus]